MHKNELLSLKSLCEAAECSLSKTKNSKQKKICLDRIKREKQDVDFTLQFSNALQQQGFKQINQYKKMIPLLSSISQKQKTQFIEQMDTVLSTKLKEIEAMKKVLNKAKRNLS